MKVHAMLEDMAAAIGSLGFQASRNRKPQAKFGFLPVHTGVANMLPGCLLETKLFQI